MAPRPATPAPFGCNTARLLPSPIRRPANEACVRYGVGLAGPLWCLNGFLHVLRLQGFVQSLREENDGLHEEIAELRARVADLEARAVPVKTVTVDPVMPTLIEDERRLGALLSYSVAPVSFTVPPACG